MAKKTRSQPTPSEPIGPIFTQLAGGQFYDAHLDPGERIHLEREPDNPHDRNAIRVDDHAFRPAGHLPRRVADWLAPLIDAGKVQAEGSVNGVDRTKQPSRTYLKVDLNLHPKGEGIMKMQADPVGSAAAMHQAVLQVWNLMKDWTDPDAARSVGLQLIGLSTVHLAPETRMLLALIRSRGRALEAAAGERAAEQVRSWMDQVRLGDAVHHEGVTLWPLHGAAVVDEPSYLLLQDALAGNLAEVSEVSEQGHVPELVVENRADRPVLIPAGEILVGAKQDRTVNATLMVAAQSDRIIGVSCVEQGRWAFSSRRFTAGRYSTPSVRSKIVSSMSASRMHGGRAHSDQGAVWSEVASFVQETGAQSRTGSLSHAFEAADEKIKEYRGALPLPDDAAGVLVAAGGRILGADLFDHPATLKALWPRLSEGYFLEAVAGRGRRVREPDEPPRGTETAGAAAEAFLRDLAAGVKVVEGAEGPGLQLEIDGDWCSGAGLWFAGRACHVAGFGKAERMLWT
ncbi:HIRAN domain-containing protein [bacterium]|nr:HIRAN domain-containing protein [bacterium]